MSLALYLDDCAFSHTLKRLLVADGHDVQVPSDTFPPLTGAPDALHFAHAQANRRIILTLNPKVFLDLHEQDPDHPGILAVYQNNDPTRDMNYFDIVRSLSNLEKIGIDLAGEFWVLNAYQW